MTNTTIFLELQLVITQIHTPLPRWRESKYFFILLESLYILQSKVIWEESTSQIRKMVFCKSGKCENLIYSDQWVITNFSQFGWSSGAPRSASGHMFCRIIPICIVKLHNHFLYQYHQLFMANTKPFIRKRSILQTSHHTNTILTSLVLNCSIGRHHGHHHHHGHQGHQHVLHDWQLYNTQVITMLNN